jgi:FSR family fosmidomycin resistance protein-like MFS transporter
MKHDGIQSPGEYAVTDAAAPSSSSATPAATPIAAPAVRRTEFDILLFISLSHGLNDLIQSLIPSIYPILKQDYALDFGQIGMITLAFYLTASILQPVVGFWTDKHPQPFSLAIGMTMSLCGLLLLSVASTYPMILLAVSLVGTGSAVFHPESSRVARMASGGRHGLAQSLFQVGGNAGTALGPILAAYIVLANGQKSVAWFSVVALAGIMILSRVGFWYRAKRRASAGAAKVAAKVAALPRPVVVRSIAILAVLIFSKFFYTASMASYYTFYLIDTFKVPVKDAQLYLFVYLAAMAVGTFLGGPIGDRFGRKFVIWLSILGVLPFTLALPHANLFWTVALTIPIGLILASAFSAIVVYAQDLVPGKVGMIAGLFFGFAFGMGGLGAAILGEIADRTSIGFVYNLCAFLPALGLLTWFLPNVGKLRHS